MEEWYIEKLFRSLDLYCVEDVLRYINLKEEEVWSLKKQLEDSRKEKGKISFIERWKLKISQEEMSKQIKEITESLNTCQTYFSYLVKFSPKLLLEYISLIVKEHEEYPFVTFFNVSTSEYESMNQMLRTYMTKFITNNPADLFRKYCSDSWEEYHLLLPEVLNGYYRKNSQPYLCFPKGKKVSVLDLEKGGILSSKLSAFPYLEEEMKKLVNYRMSHYDLGQKAVLQVLIDEKQNGQKVYQKDFMS